MAQRPRTRSADPPRLTPERLAAMRQSEGHGPKRSVSPSPSPTSPAAPPLYLVSEDAAKRKYMTFLKHREQLSARRRIGETLSSPGNFGTPKTTTAAPPAVSPTNHTPVGSSGRRFASTPSNDRANPTPERAGEATGKTTVDGLSQFELTEMVLQLQTALSSSRKENMQLRLTLRTRGIDVQESNEAGRQLGVSREYVAHRFNRGTQTILDFVEPSLVHASPSPSRPMDRIDEALEERRSKRLERLLVERTFKMGDLETMCKQAEDEAQTLRAESADRESNSTRMKEENSRLVSQMRDLEERLMVAERGNDFAEAAARNDGVLRLEISKLQSSLAAKESEATEVHGLCDFLHAQNAQLQCELDMRNLLERERDRRRRTAGEWEQCWAAFVQSFFFALAKLHAASDNGDPDTADGFDLSPSTEL